MEGKSGKSRFFLKAFPETRGFWERFPQILGCAQSEFLEQPRSIDKSPIT
jgi:hypothetical protein